MIGQKLNERYKIKSRLGEGGMGEVYLAVDEQNNQKVAVKILARQAATQPGVLDRFRREAVMLRQLEHPNIVKFLDAFDHEGQYVIVMEYMPGGSLHALMQKGPLSVERARQIALDLCDALIRAHKLNIIHRDIKPDNVLMEKDGTPKLADFGVARLTEGTRMTRSGTQVGTPYYMAPEAWEGKPLDVQADIWSLGVLLYEMLSGKVPFDGESPLTVMNRVFTTDLPDLLQIRKEVQPGFAKIVTKMLKRDKRERHKTMRQVAVDLESVEFMTAIDSSLLKPKMLESTPTYLEELTRLEQGTVVEWTEPTMHDSAKLTQVKSKQPRQARRHNLSAYGFVLAILVIIIGGAFFLRSQTPQMEPVATENVTTELPVLALTQAEFIPITSSPKVAPTPELGIGSTMVSDRDGMTLVFVPPGEFKMGSLAWSQVTHKVYLDAYWIDQTEVTNTMYIKCVTGGGCTSPSDLGSNSKDVYYANSDFGEYPVIFVNWKQAHDYCVWAGRRLPTEAEWEKAARGTDERTYPWGEAITCDKANYDNSCVGETTRVASYPIDKSLFGAYDMAGNVTEWVADWFDDKYYESSPSIDPQGPSNGQAKVKRGGSWSSSLYVARSYFRFGVNPSLQANYLGFRCALSP